MAGNGVYPADIKARTQELRDPEAVRQDRRYGVRDRERPDSFIPRVCSSDTCDNVLRSGPGPGDSGGDETHIYCRNFVRYQPGDVYRTALPVVVSRKERYYRCCLRACSSYIKEQKSPQTGDFLLVVVDNPDSLVIQYYGYGF